VNGPRRPGDRRAAALWRLYGRRFRDSSLPVPVDAIAEDLLGLRVAERDEITYSGMLIPWRREIWLNAAEARQSAGRRRFTLAHEIGHWICHCRAGDDSQILCRGADISADAPSDPRERQANVFAADLLMPEEAIRATHGDGLTTVEMADRFGVSELAMWWRLYNFYLIDEPPTSGVTST
jgi:Zn-dependent peptidase ImmA (M78 family)